MKRWVMTAAALAALAGCNESATPVGKSPDHVAEAAIPLQPQERCVSPATVAQLKQMAFNAARRISSSDPVKMNDLERDATAAISMPLLQAHDATLDRTVCTGRLRIEVPVGARSLFGGDELLADITYSMQPAADGSGLVYQVDTFGRIESAIGYADLSRFNQSTSRPAPAPLPATPLPASPLPQTRRGGASFDCAKARSNVELLICADADLAALDSRMATLYSAARRSQPGAADAQLAWIKARNKCSDASCLYGTYEDRIRQLGG